MKDDEGNSPTSCVHIVLMQYKGIAASLSTVCLWLNPSFPQTLRKKWIMPKCFGPMFWVWDCH
jgi:hypothetical protein